MSSHRNDNNINKVKMYFNSVIDWVSGIFVEVEKELCGLEWGRLYELYHNNAYDPTELQSKIRELYGDPYIKNRKGVFEYLLGGEENTKLLDVRVFDDAIKRKVYKDQTKNAELKRISNCPLCTIGNNSNKTKIWALTDMDADHVTAWSKGGATNITNCEMLCKTHNRAKGNR